MTVYNTAYDTTACVNYRMGKVVDGVREAQVRDYLPVADSVFHIERSDGAQKDIPAFKHPLYVGKHHITEIQHSNEMKLNPFLAIDVRSAGRIDPVTGNFKVKLGTMYENLVYRAALTSVWLSQGPNAFRAVSPTALSIFASWVGETVGFRYSLDPKAKIDLMILAGIFYQSNHIEGTSFDKGNEARYLSGIGVALKINVTEVARIYDMVQAIGGVEDFCNKAKLLLNNVRLEQLNAGVLISLMGATWGGDNGPEISAVALEHPPTWLSMIYEAHTNKAMRNFGLSKICERRHYQEGLDKLKASFKMIAPDSAAIVEKSARPGFGL